MNFYLLPIERVGRARGPRYFRWRYNDQGIAGDWSLKDFGHRSEIAILGTNVLIERADMLRMPVTWSQKDRDRVGGFLRSAEVEAQWVEQAGDWRAALQRLAGLSQVYQSAVDDPSSTPGMQDPSAWMGRKIHFGDEVLDALDREMYVREQDALKGRIIEPLRVRWERERPRFDWRTVLRQMALMPLSVLMGALPATDSFTTASTDKALATYSASWTVNNGAFLVLQASDDVRPNQAAEDRAHWNADTFDNDHYSQGVINNAANDAWVGVAVRVHASAVTDYGWYGEGSGSNYLNKQVSGSYTDIASNGTNFAAGITIKLSVSGTTLTPTKDGSSTGTPGAQTDSSISSGYAGISGYGTGASRLDTWEGGNNSSVTAKSGSDTLGVQASEGTTGIAGSSTQTDTDAVSFTEAASVAASSTRTDTNDVSVSESVGIQAGFSASETDDVSLIEAASIVVSNSASDDGNVSIDEAVNLAASSTRTDDLAVSLSDASPAIAASSTRADSVDLSMTEAAEVVVSISVTDTLGVAFSESTALDVNPGGSDNVDFSLGETASIVVTFSVADTLDVSFDDQGALGLTPIGVSDALSVAISEGAPTIAASLERSDGMDLSLAENASIVVTLSVSDALAFSLDEVGSCVVPVSASDASDVSVSEAVQVATTRNVFHLKWNEGYPFYPD